MPDLSGKVAIVTGCASGIGAAALARLRADGANVLGTDIAEEQGRASAAAHGAVFMVQDVADTAAWDQVTAHAVQKFGRLDILVNNAGIVTQKSIEDVDLATWDRVIATNLTGVMRGCQAAIAAMKGNPGGPSGSIINIASTTAIMPLPTDVGYSASKSGVRIVSKSVATHCAQRGYAIRCNTVIPGATETGILNKAEAAMPGLKAMVAGTSPMNRLADPAETAAAIAFLASDECPFMTGAEMLVDGGALSLHPGF